MFELSAKKEISLEKLALSSYVKYTAYTINALDRKLSKEEYSKLMDSYVNGIPVKDAVNKLEGNE